MQPKVSIVMRSMNDIDYIGETLDMIYSQRFKDFELVSVDSGSTDGTFEIIKSRNDGTVYQNDPSSYKPGKVLNEAIGKCKGEIIVFNNSDCIPQDEFWLENLIAPLQDDSMIAAAYGRQLPRKDASPLVRKDSERAYGDGEIVKSWNHFFSLATSAVRKESLEKWPFSNDLQYSEDVDWSYKMKARGFKIEYAKDAIVEHSHNYTIGQVYKRFYGEGLAEGYIYKDDVRAKSFARMFAKPYIVEVLRDILYLLKTCHLLSIPYSFVYRAVQKYAVWKGNRDYVVAH